MFSCSSQSESNVTQSSAGLKAKKELAAESELYTGPQYRNAFANPKDTSLPNILLIGDSISIGYTVEVRKKLRGHADVFRIPANGRYASYGEKNLKKWLGDKKWDVIHFNWGLWDICYRHNESKEQGHRDKIRGKLTATPKQYKTSMENIVAQLLRSKAKLIWCNTTPVPKFEAGRKVGDALKYNAIANEVMSRHDIAINDLHAHASLKLPAIMKKRGDVHFTKKGYSYLAEKVSAEIRRACK